MVPSRTLCFLGSKLAMKFIRLMFSLKDLPTDPIHTSGTDTTEITTIAHL